VTQLKVGTPPTDPKVAQAAQAFAQLFTDLRRKFPERDHILEQVELALLSREHLLLFGPPGTGKSELASTTLRAIHDDTGKHSMYQRQIVETTVQQDLIGPVDFKVLTETGRTQHRIDEGLLNFEFAVLDEAFDARDLLLRSLFSVLNEREFSVGPTVIKARLGTSLFTTNRYLSELLAARPETLLAFADRVAFAGYVPKGFAEPTSRLHMLTHAAGRGVPVKSTIKLTDLQLLRQAAQTLEVDDEALMSLANFADLFERMLAEPANAEKRSLSTRYLSGRALSKAVGIWKVAVMRDRLIKRTPGLWRVTSGDLPLLRPFFTLAGPPVDRIGLLAEQSSDPRDQAQLKLVAHEQNAFSRAHTELKAKTKKDVEAERGALGMGEIEGVASNRPLAGQLAAQKLPKARQPQNREQLARILRNSAESYLAEGARLAAAVAPKERRDQLSAMIQGLHELGDLELAQRLAQAARNELRADVMALPLIEAATEFEVSAVNLGTLGELTARADVCLKALEDAEQQIQSLSRWVGDADRQGASTAATLSDARARVAKVLRRRAGKLVARPTKAQVDLALLNDEVAPLTEIDRVLGQISPGAGRLRIELVTARAAGLLRQELAKAPMPRIGDLLDFVRGADSQLRNLELESGPILRALRPAVTARLRTWVAQRKQLLRASPSEASEAGYLGLLMVCTAALERATVQEVVRLTQAETDATAQEVLTRLEELDLAEVSEQVRYLEQWFSQLMERLPHAPGDIESVAEADAVWALVAQSRFFRTTWKEQELITLKERIRDLSERSAVAGQAKQVGAALEALLRGSEHFGRALLDRRAALAGAA
jgi:MoxR-like ATPase